MNAQKENTSRVHASSRKPMKKVCNEMKETIKNNTHVKIIFMDLGETIMDTSGVRYTNFSQWFEITTKHYYEVNN